METFELEIKKLNKGQKKAVEHIDGPLLVLAGPGTGKTQLLSMRVANILKRADVKPQNILCLTFTNKAAINMRDRIIELAGSEGSRTVVKTFHSFAGEVMNLYPDNFWQGADLSIAPESVQLDIIESIVSDLPLDNPLALSFAGQYTLLNDIQRAINLAKDAGLTPSKLSAIIDANLAYIDKVETVMVDICAPRLTSKNIEKLENKVAKLPIHGIEKSTFPILSLDTVIRESLSHAVALDAGTNKTTNVSVWKRRWLQNVDGQKGMWSERTRNEWWMALCGVYEIYRNELHQRGFYDYADMLVEVIGQLEQDPQMLADVQERFSYVMIDEFQDTNPAQLRFAHLIADHHSADGRPNMMAVGDDDQSIFKFNGAELNNMLNFRRSYPTAKTNVLTENYRSNQAILDLSKRIIEQAEDRLVKRDKSLNKLLSAQNPPAIKAKVTALSYPSREMQLSDIARQVKKIHKSNQSIAVLARNHDSLIKMSAILQQLDVPLRYELQANILEHEIIDQVYLLLKLCDAIGQGDIDSVNALVHKILRHPMWGIEPENLWQLALANRSRPDWLGSLLKSNSKNHVVIGRWFGWLARQSESQPLAVTIEYLLGLRRGAEYTSPVRDYFLKSDNDYLARYFHGLSAVQLLRSLVHEFSKNSDPTPADLIRFFEINRQNERIISDESPFVSGKGAVQLLTVHKAKGLEFDHVFIIDAIDGNWQPKKGSRKPPSNLPLQPSGDEMDDYIRLFYVAVTRARATVSVSAYHQDHAGKDTSLSPIVLNAFKVEKVESSDSESLINVIEENLHWPTLEKANEKEMLRGILDGYSLSVTHLLNFLDITRGGPAYFKERNLLRLPEAKSPSMAYGTAMHKALELGQLQKNKGRFSQARTIDDFMVALKNEHLPKADETRYAKKGEQTLSRLFNEYDFSLTKGDLPEQDLVDIRLRRAVVRGKLDSVSIGESIVVTDYKTGRPINSLTTKNKSELIKAWRGRTQLIFYALLISKSSRYPSDKEVISRMIYLEAKSKKNLQLLYQPNSEEISRMEGLVKAVFAKIQSLDQIDITKYSPDYEGIVRFEEDLLSGKV